MAEVLKLSFTKTLFVFQVLLLGLFAGYVDYKDDVSLSKTHALYSHFQDVHVMVFVGVGFLMSFLKKYGFGALSYNFLISAVCIQWATLLNAWIKQRVQQEEGHNPDHVGKIKLDIESLLTSDFTAVTVVISFGVLIGKASRVQLLFVAIFECIFFAINEVIINEFLHTTDAGGSIVVHIFAAYFGLAVSVVLQNSGDEHENEASTCQSDIFAMIGTLFLWAFWPSFNASLLVLEVNRHNRAIINTYFSLASCVATTFFVSACVNKKYKFNMVHVQNATLAGGVAVGASADLMIKPWGAILIGMCAGIISSLGYAYVTPFLNKKLKVHDTCGVHNLHGMPGIFAGIVGTFATAFIDKSDYPKGDFEAIYKKHDTRSLSKLAGYQAAAIFVALGMSISGGLITGLIIKKMDTLDEDELFLDATEFEVPNEDVNSNIHNGNNFELKHRPAKVA